MLVRIANRTGPDQTASEEAVCRCLSRPFWQAPSVPNFRTFSVDPVSLRNQSLVRYK